MSNDYNLVHALDNLAPALKRARFGKQFDNLMKAVNILLLQSDVNAAFDAGAMAFGSGTVTIASTITAGDFFTITLVNSAVPSLVSPGIVIGPVNAVTSDTVTLVAAKLVTLLNANQILIGLGYTATNSAGVVTLKTTGTAGNSLVMTATKSAGATFTVTPANPTGGTGAVVPRLSAAFTLTPPSTL